MKKDIGARTVTQCVILLGGQGTRLGSLTATIPKPLLPVGGGPFLEVLVAEASRRGFTKLLLLAGHLSEVVVDFVEEGRIRERYGIHVEIVIESEPLGTGGALVNALPKLDEAFLLLNGDTWFDFNWMDLVYSAVEAGAGGAIALRQIANPDRYETITLDGNLIVDIQKRGEPIGRALINGGVYYMTRTVIESKNAPCSFENDILPSIRSQNLLFGFEYTGYFIDIGVPLTYSDAVVSVPLQRRRPAAFLDRDGVLNIDHGYVHSTDKLDWVVGAREAVKLLNDSGYYVFVVTNQSGVARGYYEEAQVQSLHSEMNGMLREVGAYVDDWRYCPYHPEGVVDVYRVRHPWRKPEPGMILDLIEHWDSDATRSFLVGNEQTDIIAAERASIVGHLFHGDDLLDTVSRIVGNPGTS